MDEESVPDGQQALAGRALKFWLPDAEVALEPLGGARPPAQVFIVDVSGRTGSTIKPGKYVLRIGPASEEIGFPSERAAVQNVLEADREFARLHIPQLQELYTEELDGRRWIISLHDLAGGSLRRFAQPAPESTGLLRITQALSRELLSAWARPDQVRRVPLSRLLTEVVGADRAAPCLNASRAMFNSDEDEVYYENGHTFLNPALFFRDSGGDDIEIPLMAGLCHRDLHIGNLHVSRDEVAEDEYWIVDCFQAKDAFVGFDHAYLELSVLLNYVSMGSTVLARCLDTVEEGRGPSPSGTYWLEQFLTEMRAGISSWVAEQPGRSDDLNRQFMLMRMIAGLYWARRFDLESEKARLCIAYAGWYARKLQAENPDSLPAPRPAPARSPDLTDSGDDAATSHIWELLWSAVDGFSAQSTRYVLVCEQMPRTEDLAALGHVPWSVVIDLDPASDRDGLYSAAGPVLSTQRALHTLSGPDRPFVDFTRSTAWLMAAGSTLRREPYLQFREWVWKRLDAVRQLMASFRRSVGDSQIIVVVLPTVTETAASDSRDRLLRVLEVVDESLQDGPRYVYVGLATVNPPVQGDRIPLATAAFLTKLSGTLGSRASIREYGLPGPSGGRVTLSPETMRVLQEHLEILHEDIEGWDLNSARADEAFWRGGLISWADLDAGRDVIRTISPRLNDQLTGSLDQHRTRTIVLQHQPGAGGTTAALRAAWDLHHRNPVAVLRMGVAVEGHRIQVLADRLHRLFVLTEMPVLFVAEDSDLSEANRETLYRELASRSARVTILYVRRIAGGADDSALAVSDPLDEEESGIFERQYMQLASDASRLEELAILGTPKFERYRTPFFYGLITFEREFTKLSKYVQDHVGQVRGRVQDILEFIALATIFSNSGLQMELVQKLMRLPTDVNVEVDDMIGPRPARLITVRAGRLRLLHQLLAEEVLARWLGESGAHWETNLGNLAMGFIEAISVTTDPSSDPIRILFRQVFVDRQGGQEDGAEDKKHFAPLIERLDRVDPSLGHQVLKTLSEYVPEEPHFWNHLGRHQMYRLERDLDKAEEYLLRAIDLAPDDHVHHHTLGLVRRSRMRQAVRSARQKGVSGVLEAIDVWFYQTAECFIRARQLSPEDIYGYITHVQAIIDVAKALMEAGRVTSVKDLTSGAADWIAEYLAVANELLDVAAQLYNTLERRDDYLNRCLADIRKLYGDLDAVIELWEAAAAGPLNTPMSRRSLAQAYYVRGNRTWRDLSLAELRRIVELANQNLSYPGAKEEDYRLWFEAYKLLPTFDMDEALGRLQQWAARFPSWRVQYYRYCLMFYLWFTGRSDDADLFRVAQQQSLEYMLGRAKRSFLWLAKGPEQCPLVADTDLGEWDRQQNFWKETGLLLRVNGVIDYMTGPQAGAIQLDRGVNAFFVPAAGGFLPDSDEGVPVNFFLGFSPEGLRAWGVQRYHSDKAVWARSGRTLPTAQFVGRPVLEVSALDISTTAGRLLKEKILKVCTAILTARSAIGLETRLSDLSGRVDAIYRSNQNIELKAILSEIPGVRIGQETDPVLYAATDSHTGVGDVEGAEGEAAYVTFIGAEGRYLILELARGGRLRVQSDDINNPALLAGLKAGQVVRCTIAQTRVGAMARSVEILDSRTSLVAGELVEPARLHQLVEDAIRGELEDRLARGLPDMSLSELAGRLDEQFRGGAPLTERLGVRNLAQFVSKVKGVSVSGGTRSPIVHIRNGRAFGRMSSPLAAPGAPEEAGAPADLVDVDAILTELVQECRAAGREATLQFLGGALRPRLGPAAYEAAFHGALKSALAVRPGWSLTQRSPDVFVLQRADALDLDALLAELVAECRAAGREATLQVLGVALRKRLGTQAYEAEFGGGLKAALAKRPGWTLIQRNPSVSVLQPTADLDAVLAELVEGCRAAGREATLQVLGTALRARLGPERYEAEFGGGLKTALAARPGWSLIQRNQSTFVLVPGQPGAPDPDPDPDPADSHAAADDPADPNSDEPEHWADEDADALAPQQEQ